MKNKSLFIKIIQFLLYVSFIIWLGSYVSRHLLVYQLFEPRELELRSLISVESLSNIFYVLLPILVTNIISYSIFFITFIMFLSFSKISLKQNGWLFICTLIIFITAPFEFYLLIKDYSIVDLIYNNSSPDSLLILDLLRKRITLLNSFSLIEIFSYLAVIYLVITKPLVKLNEAERERT